MNINLQIQKPSCDLWVDSCWHCIICTHHAQLWLFTRQFLPSADSHVPLVPNVCGLQSHLFKLQILVNDALMALFTFHLSGKTVKIAVMNQNKSWCHFVVEKENNTWMGNAPTPSEHLHPPTASPICEEPAFCFVSQNTTKTDEKKDIDIHETGVSLPLKSNQHWRASWKWLFMGQIVVIGHSL